MATDPTNNNDTGGGSGESDLTGLLEGIVATMLVDDPEGHSSSLSSLVPDFSSVTELSTRQIKAVFYLQPCMAVLSIIGNALILQSIWRRRLYDSVYGRLMLGVSVSNCITVTTLALEPLAVPAEHLLGPYGARGNQQTCTAAGFCLLFGLSSNIFYLASLMLHFVLTICYKFREEWIKKRLEPFFHILALSISLGFSLTGLILELFNPLGVVPGICFIQDLPQGCTEMDFVECQRGESADQFMWRFVLGPGLILYAFLNVCLVLVYRKVLQRASESQRISRRIHWRFSTFKHYKAVERQSSFYAINYFLSLGLTFMLPLAMRIVDPLEHQQAFYRIQVVNATIWPLQGFFSFIIFTLPRYAEIAGRNIEEPRWWILRQAVFSKRASDKIRGKHSQSSSTVLQSFSVRTVPNQNIIIEETPSSSSPDNDKLDGVALEAVASSSSMESRPASAPPQHNDEAGGDGEPSPSSLLEITTAR